MSTLAHVFEAAGLATVALGSVRKQIEEAAPPRGLWCNFPLGRPLGKPGDAAFQMRVLKHAFSLLDATEPVFEEFPERVSDENNEALSCPMPPRTNKALHPLEGQRMSSIVMPYRFYLLKRLQDEVATSPAAVGQELIQLLASVNMKELLDMTLTRDIGRAHNLEVWQ